VKNFVFAGTTFVVWTYFLENPDNTLDQTFFFRAICSTLLPKLFSFGCVFVHTREQISVYMDVEVFLFFSF